ncbi:MAG: DsbA family protein [Hyphomonadaceae bacterium]
MDGEDGLAQPDNQTRRHAGRPRQVEFFYDFTSPTAYLAWRRLPDILARTGAVVSYRPMFLGGVMQPTGNRPPGTLPQKGKWMAALARACITELTRRGAAHVIMPKALG